MWERAYETRVFDSQPEVVGRGSTPETSREAAQSQWERDKKPVLPTPAVAAVM